MNIIKKRVLIFFCFIEILILSSFVQSYYNFNNEPIDAVIPCHEKDKNQLELVINGIRKNVKNINRIIIVSSEPYTNLAEWFDEHNFPFTKYSIALELFKDPERANQYINSPKTRIGWIFQQLIKLYSLLIIPNISSNVLIVDADTFFLNSVSFQDEYSTWLYNVGKENHQPYFIHGAKLIPGFKRVFKEYSGVCHHMIFQRAIIEDMFKTIQKVHNIEPWKAIVRCIDIDQNGNIDASCMSEYELYFNFVFDHTKNVKIRPLKWDNINNLSELNFYKNKDYHYVSKHIYIS